MRITCVYGPQAEDETLRKFVFMMKWRVSGHDLESSSEIIVSLGGSMDKRGNVLRVLKVYAGGMELGKKCRRKKIAGAL